MGMITGKVQRGLKTVTIGQDELTRVLNDNHHLEVEVACLRELLTLVMDSDGIERALERMNVPEVAS